LERLVESLRRNQQHPTVVAPPPPAERTSVGSTTATPTAATTPVQPVGSSVVGEGGGGGSGVAPTIAVHVQPVRTTTGADDTEPKTLLVASVRSSPVTPQQSGPTQQVSDGTN